MAIRYLSGVNVDSNTLFVDDANNRVGIGTGSPAYRLHVNLNAAGYIARIQGSTNNISFYDGGSGGIGIGTDVNQDLKLYTNDALNNGIVIKPSGNVGIGTTSPGRKLHVDNASGVGEAVISGTTGATLYFRPNASYSAAGNFGIFTTGLTSGTYESTMTIKGYSSAVTDVMTIKGSGNVGIGTTSPSTNLHVAGSVRVTGDRIDVNSNTRITGAYYENSNTEYTYIDMYNGGNASINIGTKHPLSYISFESGSGAYTERMRITNTGNVGIGTTSPETGLHYQGNLDGELLLLIANTKTYGVGTGINETSALGFAIKEGSTALSRLFGKIIASTVQETSSLDGLLTFQVRGGGTLNTFMTATSAGNVGIGTTSPSQKLEVSGNIKLSNNSYVAWRNAANNADIPLLQLTSANEFNIGTTSSSVPATIKLHTNSAEGARLTSGGQFIVGGTTVGYAGTKLQVGNTSDSQNGLNILTSTTGYGYILFGDGAAADTYVGQITYKHGDDYMSFQTNGSEKVRILSNGNFGIGTTNPGTKLHVNNGIITVNDGTGITYYEGVKTHSYNANGYSVIGREGLTLSTVSAGKNIILSPTGNVGIGNTSPSHKLDISGDLNVNHTANVVAIRVGGIAAIGRGLNTDGTRINGGSTDGIEFTPNNDATIKMVIKPSGNVGIGTTSPASKLHVYNSASGATPYATGLTVENSGRVSLNLLSPTANDSYIFFGNPTAGNAGYVGYENTANRLILKSNDYVSLLDSTGEVIRIDGGNVGIGTTSPTQKLDVRGGDDQSGIGVFAIGTSGGTSLRFGGNSTYSWVQSHNSKPLYINELGNSVILNLFGGNVGIGTASPGYKLHVVGDTRIEGNLTINGTVTQIDTDTLTTEQWLVTNDGTGPAVVINQKGSQPVIDIQDDGTSVLYIEDGGDVGIGTTSPSQKLDVAGNIALSTGGYIYGDSTTPNIRLSTAGGAFLQYGSSSLQNGGSLQFVTASGTMFRINSSGGGYVNGGNFGIGTTSPDTLLHLLAANPEIRITDTSNTNYNSIRNVDGNFWIEADKGNELGNSRIRFTVDGTEYMTINTTGNVGIGTTGPTEKLHVVGNVIADEYKYNGAERVESKNWKYVATVAAGYYEELGEWRATEGNVALRITVQSNTSSHSGTAVYILQGGFNQAVDGWFELLPAFKGGGHGDAQNGWKVLWYDNASYSYKLAVAVPSGLAQKVLHVSVELLGNPSGDSYYQYNALSTTGVIPSYSLERTTSYSHRDIVSSDTVTAQYDASNYTVLGYDSLDTYGGSQVFKTAGTERMRLSTVGNLSIGNTNNTFLLDIGASSLYPFRAISSSGAGFQVNGSYAYTDAYNHIFRSLSGTTTYATIDNNGRLGIGTTAPSFPLHVDATTQQFRISGNTNHLNIFSWSSGVNIWSSENLYFGRDTATANKFFFQNGSGSATTLYVNTATEKVGIGTTSPSYKLDIRTTSSEDAQIALRNTSTGNAGIYFDASNGDLVGSDYVWIGQRNDLIFDINTSSGAGDIVLSPGGTERVRFAKTGNVGIGTTSPQVKLEVRGAQNNTIAPANAVAKFVGNDAGVFVGNLAGTPNYGAWIQAMRESDALVFPLHLQPNGGNVGIGTTSPVTTLQVNATSPAIRLQETGSGGDKRLDLSVNSSGVATIAANQSAQVLTFETVGSERMRITAAGTVGIGTTSPSSSYKLDVAGAIRTTVVGGYTIDASATFGDNSGGTITIINRGTTRALRILGTTSSGWGDVLINPYGAYVGIGTTDPTQALHVSGSARVTGAYYDSNNSAGSSGQVLSSTGSGTAWVNQGEAVASSLFDLLPNARVTYDWTVQLTAGTWADIFSSNTVLSNGTWMVQAYVNDFAVGGQQYQETYSGIMSWGNASSTNQGGAQAISEVVLHRSGHAANAGNFYLRTVERASSTLLFQGMSNQTYSAASTINFKFVKIF